MKPTVKGRDVLRVVAASAALVLGLPCGAQQARAEFSLEAGVTATNNSGYALRERAESDFIVSLSPRLRLNRRAAGYALVGDLGFDALTYLNGTQKGRVLPSSRVALAAQLVDRWLFLDASNLVQQTSADSLSVVTNQVSTVNKVTTYTNHLSPYVDHDFGNGLSLQARADLQWQKNSQDFVNGAPQRDSDTTEYTGKVHYMPSVVGVGFEFEDMHVDYSGNAVAALDSTALRGVLSYALNRDTVLSVVGGKENSRIALVEQRGTIYGARAQWQPNQRQRVVASMEHRYFGTGWSLDVTQRSPMFAAGVSLSRQASTQQTAFGLARAAGGDTASLLDAMLTTRYPNASERGVLVQNIINDLGLPRQVDGSIDIFANYAQLWRSASATIAILGRLTAVTLNVYSQRAESLTIGGVSLGGLASSADADVRQSGGTVDVNRRLTPTMSAGISLRRSEVDGLGVRFGSYSRDSTVRVRLSNALSPRTSVRIGFGVQRSTSNLNSDAVQEVSGFAVLSHRF